MLIEFNLAVIGEKDECPVQVIARARRTDKDSPITQLTTTKCKNETEESYINRLRINLRTLIAPYGYAHHIVLLCRYEARNDPLANDAFQNLSAKLRHVAKNSENQMERVKALSLYYDMISSF